MSTGMWVAVWAALAVGALVAFVAVGVHLFGKARAVVRQAQESTVVFAEFERALAEAQEPTMPEALALLAGPERRRGWTHRRRLNLVRRARRKAARRRATLRRWREIPIPPAKS